MRAGGEWIASKEDLTDSTDAWVEMGFMMADVGLVVIVVATVLAGFAARRGRRPGGSSGAQRISGVLVSLLLVAYLVAVWTMTTKPV
jgi:threonine/homoserine/homoserine lactone efflux protein